MKTALINASPKKHNSASGSLLEELSSYIRKGSEVVEIGLHKTLTPEDFSARICNADVWVFASPLYVDSLPSHLLSCLVQLEKAHFPDPETHIYGIVNCGFYEGIQAAPALRILQNWCLKTGNVWGGGIGIGGGGGLAQMPTLKNGHGPKAPVHKALQRMAENILQHTIQENDYVSVAFPRILYKMSAQIGWRQMIRANGGKRKDLGKKF